jgi:hypothetical protein
MFMASCLERLDQIQHAMIPPIDPSAHNCSGPLSGLSPCLLDSVRASAPWCETLSQPSLSTPVLLASDLILAVIILHLILVITFTIFVTLHLLLLLLSVS